MVNPTSFRLLHTNENLSRRRHQFHIGLGDTLIRHSDVFDTVPTKDKTISNAVDDGVLCTIRRQSLWMHSSTQYSEDGEERVDYKEEAAARAAGISAAFTSNGTTQRQKTELVLIHACVCSHPPQGSAKEFSPWIRAVDQTILLDAQLVLNPALLIVRFLAPDPLSSHCRKKCLGTVPLCVCVCVKVNDMKEQEL